MKAPRRVPWASHAELEELYEMLFAPSADSTTRRKGLARMSIYVSSPSCPSFIHLLHSLVSIEILPVSESAEETQRLRMMLGMGIVRFVNGLVDPLQTGPYARPISHLAATLGLPPSLIALRHRATHEDLPPLPLLQSALGQCISYLHHYSFLPLLASSSGPPPGVLERAEASKKRVEGLMKRWKRVMKIRLRDNEVREEDETAKEMRKVRRELETEDGQVIVGVLVREGGLVPIAPKKRATLKLHLPPTPSLKIWQPLLLHLTASHPEISSQLASEILEALLNEQTNSSFGETRVTEEETEDRRSFKWGLAVWFVQLWVQEALTAEDKGIFMRRLLAGLLDLHEDVVIRNLHSALLAVDPSLSSTSALVNLLPEAEADGLQGLEVDADVDMSQGLETMERRLAEFESMTRVKVSNAIQPTPTRAVDSAQFGGRESAGEVPGWRRLTNEQWKPCPIGAC